MGGIFRAVFFFAVILSAGQARADNCPDFYRFVDFGLIAQDGEVYRGGPTFRAESFEGAPMLVEDRTECRAVREVSSDGHGNPIPLVERVYYMPERTGIDLSELSLTAVEDSTLTADEYAVAHRVRLATADIATTRGEDFLCAHGSAEDAISCQIVSPYPGNIALVVYCDARQCEMPGMAIRERVVAGAVWPRPAATLGDPQETGMRIVEKAKLIHDFLDPLSYRS